MSAVVAGGVDLISGQKACASSQSDITCPALWKRGGL